MTDTAVNVTEAQTPGVDAAAIAAAVAAELSKNTPAPAPVAAAPTPEPVATTATPEIGKIEPFSFPPSGDAGLDIALEYIGNFGLTDQHPAVIAAANGDFTQIETYLSAVKAPGYEKYLNLAKEAHARQTQAVETQATKINEAVFGVFEGEENWKKASAFAKENGTKEEIDQLNAMLRAGPLQAKAAALMIRQAYEAKVGGFTKDPKDPTAQTGQNGAVAPGPKPVLNRRTLISEIEGLRRQYGDNFQNTDAYRALHAQYENR
ncbi:scaffold protein [Caulobacter phage Quill_5.2]|uniref:Scaffold protein n=1 Tax=Caulobacter phage Quill_5.2 TaxID=3075108 RepID=A0AA96PWW3_9CAUD|nr:scaffold protein [Caulobacter phage Quill_5.2]